MCEYFGSVKSYKSSESILCKEYNPFKTLRNEAVSGLMKLQYEDGNLILKEFIESAKNL